MLSEAEDKVPVPASLLINMLCEKLDILEDIPTPLIVPPVKAPVTAASPPTLTSSVTVKSSCTFKSTTLRLAKASTIAAPEPAPSE